VRRYSLRLKSSVYPVIASEAISFLDKKQEIASLHSVPLAMTRSIFLVTRFPAGNANIEKLELLLNLYYSQNGLKPEFIND